LAARATRTRSIRRGASVMIAIAAVAAVASDNDVDYARRLAIRVNEYRSSEHVAPLALDATLSELAREHSAAMARAGTSHDDFPPRVRRSGYARCVATSGGTISRPTTSSTDGAHRPGHERNVLDGRVDRTGCRRRRRLCDDDRSRQVTLHLGVSAAKRRQPGRSRRMPWRDAGTCRTTPSSGRHRAAAAMPSRRTAAAFPD